MAGRQPLMAGVCAEAEETEDAAVATVRLLRIARREDNVICPREFAAIEAAAARVAVEARQAVETAADAAEAVSIGMRFIHNGGTGWTLRLARERRRRKEGDEGNGPDDGPAAMRVAA